MEPLVLWAAAAVGAAAIAGAPAAGVVGALGVAMVAWRRGARPLLLAGCAVLFVVQAIRGARAIGHAREAHAAAVDALTPPAVCVIRGVVVESPIASIRDESGERPATIEAMARANVSLRASVRTEDGGACEDRVVPVGLVLRLYDLPEDLRRGDEIEATAKVLPAHLFEHAELPSPWPGIARSEIVGSGAAMDAVVVRRERSIAAGIDAARGFVRRRILATYAPGAAELARALVLGETDLADEDSEAFRDSGLLHLLAVSGTHLVLVVSALAGALRWILLRIEAIAARTDAGRAASVIGIAIAWLYSDFAGGSGSAVRAAAMLTVVLAARAMGARPSPGRALALGLFGAAIVDPLVALDMSFGLSAGATAGLVLLGGPISERLSGWVPGGQKEAAEERDGAPSRKLEPLQASRNVPLPSRTKRAIWEGRTSRSEGRGWAPELRSALLGSAPDAGRGGPPEGRRELGRAPRKNTNHEEASLALRLKKAGFGALRFVLASVGTTLAATIGSTPALLRFAPRMPVLGVIANIVAAPLGELVALPVCLGHAVASPVGPIERGLALVGSGALLAVRAIARRAASLGGAVNVPPPSPWQLAAIAIFGAAIALAGDRRARMSCGAMLAAALLVLEIANVRAGAPRGKLRVTALDVGQGDAILIDFPDGEGMLVDGGGMVGNPVDPGARVILPVLAARRRTRLDVIALTHPHPDHFTGLASVARAVPFGELWETGQGEMVGARGAYAGLLGAARSKGAAIRRPKELCGRPRMFGEARVEVLAPCPDVLADTPANDASLVLRIDFGERSALLVGDAERDAERALLASGARLHADLLKVGHHGSRTSSSEDFLRAVDPRYAMISCGVRNRFGHPHPAAMERIAATRASVFRTDRGGEILWETDGETARAARPAGP
ncbi:MAG: ComEC/Rec2 family competence protein [Polyangiaceae bacterium]